MAKYRLYKYVLLALTLIIIIFVPPIIIAVVVGHMDWYWSILIGWLGVLAFLQFLGWSLRDILGWEVIRIYEAFDRTAKRTLQNIQDELFTSGRLDRTETQQVWQNLKQGRPVLLIGEGGSGKSGLAAAVIRRALNSDMPTLFLDTLNYSATVTSTGGLSEYVGVNLSLTESLEKLASQVGQCLLVIDQLDSAIGTPACQVSTELLASAATINKVMVLGVSRPPLNSNEYQPIRNLQFEVIKSELLGTPQILSILQEMGVATPTKHLVSLSENLLNLSLIGELIANGVEVNQLEGEIELWEKYKENLQHREGVEAVQTAIDLAYETFNEGNINFPLPRIQEIPLQRLQSRGLIISTGHDLYRFRHEQFLYFFYAQGAIDNNNSPVEIIDRIAGRRAEEVLVWVLRIYYHRHSPELQIYLSEALTGAAKLDFYEKAALLDEVQNWSDINASPTVLEVVLTAISADTALEQYFFRHLGPDINWYEVLLENGYLTNPPDPVRTGDDLDHPEWPVSAYLFNVAPELPSQVVNVAREIQTENIYVKKRLLWTAQRMPGDYAAEIAQIAGSWEGLELQQLNEEILRFAEWLAIQAQWEAVLGLIDLILSPQQYEVPEDQSFHPFWSYPKAIPLSNDYTLGQFSRVFIEILEEHKPLETMQIVEGNIEKIVEIEALNGDDFFSHWPDTIEPSGQDFGEELYRLLLIVTAVRMLNAVIQLNPDQGGAILEGYLAHRYTIFWRLAIDAVRKNANIYPDLVNNLLANDLYLDDHRVYHEYWKLMEDTFYLLPHTDQNDFTARLFAKIPQEPVQSEEYFHYQRHLRLKQLWAIREHLSSEEHRRMLGELVDQYGEPDYPSLRSRSSLSVGSASPRTSEEINNLSQQELLSELKRNLPLSSFEPDEPDQEGFGHELRTTVTNAPERFAAIAPQLIASDIAPLYTSNVLFGFQQALAVGRTFDWESVLDLCEIVSRTQEETPETGDPPDLEPGYWQTTYASSRKMVALLLETGLTRDDVVIPDELLQRSRDILFLLSDDINPSIEYERRWGLESPHGIRDLAPNVIRGRAIQALIKYAVRVSKIGVPEQPTGPDPSLSKPAILDPKWISERLHQIMRFLGEIWRKMLTNNETVTPLSTKREIPVSARRLEPEVKERLTEKLKKDVESSLAVHYLFGQFIPTFHYLDEEWLIAHLENIFPRKPEMLAYWEVVYEGYFSNNRFNPRIYEILRPYYQYAIERLLADDRLGISTGLADAGLIKHLENVYYDGIEDIADNASLIKLFFEIAPDVMRARFVTGLQHKLKETDPNEPTNQWLRAKLLLDVRATELRKNIENQTLNQVVEELKTFVGWVPIIPSEDLRDYYDLVDHSALCAESPDVFRLLKYLSSVAQIHFVYSVSLLEKMLRRYNNRWIFAGENIVRTILEAAMNSGDVPAKNAAHRIINLFGEQGNHTYRDLLRQ